MDYSPEKWLAPRQVDTPDVPGDVAKYIKPDFDQDAFNRLTPGSQKTLTLLVERLEFIDHLTGVVQFMEPYKKVVKVTDTPLDGGLVRRTETYSIILGGHEYAGFDFDVDAITLYLLCTCIDTLKGQPYKSPFNWLAQQPLTAGIAPDWTNLEKQFNEVHGLSQNFKKAFTVDCSSDLKETLIENLAVVKLGPGVIKTKSIETWENSSPAKKVELIASHLYNIRSKFTHSSFRTLTAETPVDQSFATKDAVIVQRVGGVSLRTILDRIVRHLAVTLLIEKEQLVCLSGSDQ